MLLSHNRGPDDVYVWGIRIQKGEYLMGAIEPPRPKGLTFGPCSRCHKEVMGHAVYLDGQLLCMWCDLDLVVNLSLAKLDLDKIED